MKDLFKEKILVLKIIFIICTLWISITSSIQRVKNPRLTETELFLLIPNNFILSFK